jgi:hypothetical protein
MNKNPSLIDLPKPSLPSVPLLENSKPISDNTIFYLVIGVISLGILYYVMKDNNDSVPEERKDKFIFPNLDNIDPVKAIELTHKTCPVLGGPNKFSVCVQYPPLNKGFIVSVCCESCAQRLQKSFNTGDGEYTIKEDHGMNILYHNSEPKQVTPLCSAPNMKLVTEKAGTQMMKGNNQ